MSDIQQGTTAEGVHLGAMAGTVDLVQRVTTGIEVTGDVLRLNPQLPPELERLDMRIRYRGHSLDLRLTRDTLTVRGRETGVAPIRLGIKGEIVEFEGGSTTVFPFNRLLKNSHLAAVLESRLVRRSAVYARGYYASAGLSAGATI